MSVQDQIEAQASVAYMARVPFPLQVTLNTETYFRLARELGSTLQYITSRSATTDCNYMSIRVNTPYGPVDVAPPIREAEPSNIRSGRATALEMESSRTVPGYSHSRNAFSGTMQEALNSHMAWITRNLARSLYRQAEPNTMLSAPVTVDPNVPRNTLYGVGLAAGAVPWSGIRFDRVEVDGAPTQAETAPEPTMTDYLARHDEIARNIRDREAGESSK